MDEFELKYTPNAEEDLRDLIEDKGKNAALKAVVKCLKLMGQNLKHPSLNTHKYEENEGSNGEEVFEFYAQNKTPSAYRIFWHYGPGKKKITVLEICPHP